ncbi:MAG TPA: hypothetical protein PJ982_11600, partial [Lacipirellulaceae bacterium]|nr:hypothetical protein [Lacipirellulaceae bacterium]
MNLWSAKRPAWPDEPGSFTGWWPWRTRAVARRSLVRLLAAATEERLALAPLLEAWAVDQRGVQQRRVRRLAQLLREGVPLAEAVEQAPGALGDADVLAVQFGVQSGALATTLRDAVAHDANPAGPQVRKMVLYLGFVALAAAAIVAFTQVKIAPMFQQIYDDFDLDTPLAFRAATRVADGLASFWPVAALAALAAAWIAFTIRGGRWFRRQVAGRLLQPVRELRSADVLQKLQVAAAAGRPLAGSLSTLARQHYDPAMRHKLLFVRNELEQGAEPWDSMAAAGLLDGAEADLLRSADRLGNRPWALGEL